MPLFPKARAGSREAVKRMPLEREYAKDAIRNVLVDVRDGAQDPSESFMRRLPVAGTLQSAAVA
jgi:hypothetical protein